MNLYNIENKKILFCYSDPGGAKPILAIAKRLHKKNEIIIVTNRNYDFVSEFELDENLFKNNALTIKLSNPDILITGTSYTSDLEISLISEAIELNIPTISFVDNWSGFDVRFSRDSKTIIPDLLFVIDDKAKNNAIAFGFESKNILVVVNPY